MNYEYHIRYTKNITRDRMQTVDTVLENSESILYDLNLH